MNLSASCAQCRLSAVVQQQNNYILKQRIRTNCWGERGPDVCETANYSVKRTHQSGNISKSCAASRQQYWLNMANVTSNQWPTALHLRSILYKIKHTRTHRIVYHHTFNEVTGNLPEPTFVEWIWQWNDSHLTCK